jgi:hypothetical protein
MTQQYWKALHQKTRKRCVNCRFLKLSIKFAFLDHEFLYENPILDFFFALIFVLDILKTTKICTLHPLHPFLVLKVRKKSKKRKKAAVDNDFSENFVFNTGDLASNEPDHLDGLRRFLKKSVQSTLQDKIEQERKNQVFEKVSENVDQW